MRTPTPDSIAYRWHRDMLAGDRPATHDGDPQCGWFKTRLIKGGPWVPARIWIEREIDHETGELCGPEEYRCEINGESKDPMIAWSYLAHSPISEADHAELVYRRSFAAGMSDATKKIDLTEKAMRP